MPAERGAEGARRAVADALGDVGKPEVVAAEQIPRDGHPPGEQVFHRRQADSAREAFEERRARQRGRLREFGHGPRTRDVAVHLPQLADSWPVWLHPYQALERATSRTARHSRWVARLLQVT
jgi:hypothetical protein